MAVQNLSDEDLAWTKTHSARVTISQAMDPAKDEPTGTVTLIGGTIDLGETPPFFRYELQTPNYPVMLGDKHQRQFFEIYATSLIATPGGVKKAWPLWVRYPRWAGPNAGLETSGGFVFVRSEAPLNRIGVIVPNVIPEQGESADDLRWQIQIRVNDRLDSYDFLAAARLQSLGPDVVVLMATHPEKLPARSLVAWFRFEIDGTVTLIN